MAGGKETPRQKMIGMMYLVLTALLALNVSKQIVAAFVTLNDKLDGSAQMIGNQTDSYYSSFEKKKTTLKAQNGSPEAIKDLEMWQNKSHQVENRTKSVVSFLLSECNEMIKTSEGKDWYDNSEEYVDENGYIFKLKPLSDIAGMDNYDIPTNMFIGGNPEKPIERGMALRDSIIGYRNAVAEIMMNYKDSKGTWSFTAPETLEELDGAMATCNPDDTAALRSFMNSFNYPEEVEHKIHGEVETTPWPSVMFDHAPIVAAAAMLTSMKLDVKNAELMASQHLLSKVDVQEFDFNKIEPLAFASTGYINQGDSLNLKVMIAAYDSTETPKVSWGQDADTSNKENWQPANNPDGSISLKGDSPGNHKLKGVIYVKQRGVDIPKPWEFNYTVGQPMGVVAQPEMRILYWGYNNVVEGTASGYDPSLVQLSGSGCSLSPKGNGQYIAKVSRGTRNAKISVSAQGANLGSFDFECRPMPNATVYFGKTEMGGKASYTAAKNQSKVRVGYDPSVPLKGVTFSISGGIVKVDGVPGTGKVTAGGKFDSKAKSLLKQSKNKQVTIVVDYKGPDGVGKKGGISFSVK